MPGADRLRAARRARPGHRDEAAPALRTGPAYSARSRRREARRAVARCSTLTLRWAPLTDRSIAQEEKRRLILDAAVRVFAREGYHTCRVGDIAEEAGVAHGLLYHYFTSKEEVLETVFRDTWTEVLDAFKAVEASDEPPREQLRHV